MRPPLETESSTPLPTVEGGWFPAQWLAVSAPIGPVMVLAGPGAGKTRCLTGRIQYLVEEMHAAPQRICAVTFTNKAAEEIIARLRQNMGPVAEQPWLGTIHALCLELLRPFARAMRLPPGFGVADENQQLAILNRLRVWKTRHRQLLGLFGLRRLTRYKLTHEDEATFNAYCAELERHRLIDYDGILALTRQLLDRDPGALASFQNRWDHLLVDEFQDLDPCQYEILAMIAARHRSLFVVGDDEQSIFAWRGADPNLARRFQLEFQAKPIVLDVNCRCSVPIFETARRILPQDGSLFEKDIRARRVRGALSQSRHGRRDRAGAARTRHPVPARQGARDDGRPGHPPADHVAADRALSRLGSGCGSARAHGASRAGPAAAGVPWGGSVHGLAARVRARESQRQGMLAAALPDREPHRAPR